jgi:hypothetical protein
MNMKPEADQRRIEELRGLISGLCDGELQPHEAARLEELVAGDAVCREYYVTAMHISAALPRYVGADRRSFSSLIAERQMLNEVPVPSVPGSVATSGNCDQRVDDQASIIPAFGNDAAESAFAVDHDESTLGGWWKPGVFGTIGGIMFGFLLISAWSYLFGLPWQTEQQESAKSVAVSEQTERVSKPPSEVVDRSGINSVHLDLGTATLKLPGIGQVIVEGPAQFDMLSAKRARLSSGRIKMRVTEKEGHGFVVETPYGEVTDLGTEFGLDLSERGKAGLVVFEGAVDLSVAGSQWGGARDAPRVERLVGGEGLEFGGSGRISRIMSIVTGNVPTFRSQPDGDSRERDRSIIVRVTDNRQIKETKKFYEIVPHGLREDALAYVDRPHEWNGVNEAGLPTYLIDADYVRTFNQDNAQKSLEINVTLAGPAKLYVFFDDRFPLPDWLKENFHDTGDRIGKDSGRWGIKNRNSKLARGAGLSIDHEHAIWERTVKEAGTITLGAPNEEGDDKAAGAMYGIAAVPLSDAAVAEIPSPMVAARSN